MQTNELAEAFRYLDALRESGTTNMFGAAPYLANRYGLEDKLARKILTAWMTSFDEALTAEERAETKVSDFE